MATYHFDGFEFEPPSGLEDETVASFTPRPGAAAEDAFAMTVVVEDLVGEQLSEHIDRRVEELGSALDGFSLKKRTNQKSKQGLACVRLEFGSTDRSRRSVRQLQTYFQKGQKVLVVTVSGAPASSLNMSAKLKAFADQVC